MPENTLLIIDAQSYFIEPPQPGEEEFIKKHDLPFHDVTPQEVARLEDCITRIRNVTDALYGRAQIIWCLMFPEGEKRITVISTPEAYRTEILEKDAGMWKLHRLHPKKNLFDPNLNDFTIGKETDSAFGSGMLDGLLDKTKNLYVAGFHMNICVKETCRDALEWQKEGRLNTDMRIAMVTDLSADSYRHPSGFGFWKPPQKHIVHNSFERLGIPLTDSETMCAEITVVAPPARPRGPASDDPSGSAPSAS